MHRKAGVWLAHGSAWLRARVPHARASGPGGEMKPQACFLRVQYRHRLLPFSHITIKETSLSFTTSGPLLHQAAVASFRKLSRSFILHSFCKQVHQYDGARFWSSGHVVPVLMALMEMCFTSIKQLPCFKTFKRISHHPK